MFTHDSLGVTDGPTEATTRWRLWHPAVAVAATAPQAALAAGGAAHASPVSRHGASPHPESGSGAPVRLRRHRRLVSNGDASTDQSRHQYKGGFTAARTERAKAKKKPSPIQK